MALMEGQPGLQSRSRPEFGIPQIPASLATIFRRPFLQPQRREVWPLPDHAFELDCLRGVLPPGLLAAAEARAAALGIGADRVLIQWGAINEDDYVARLARHCGLATEDFRHIKRRDCPFSDAQLGYSAQHMMLPLRSHRGDEYVLAPVNLAARRIAELSKRFPGPRVRLTTQTALTRFLMRQPCFADEAADGLAENQPDFSAATSRARSGPMAFLRYAVGLPTITAMIILAPLTIIQVFGAALAVWFLLFNSLRLAGAFAPRLHASRLPRLEDNQLPVYTILAALYREGRSVAGLLRALEALDYPPEKLDVKLIIEADDRETRNAIENLHVPSHVQIIVAPAYGPRTKPKAMNYALPFARGTFLAVFDAEDRRSRTSFAKRLIRFIEAGKTSPACKPAFASTIRRTAGSPACSPLNMPVRCLPARLLAI
jgi:hypothetical protein